MKTEATVVQKRMRVQDTALVHETKKIPSLVQVLPEGKEMKH